MLDIKVIRENPERVKAAMKSRNNDCDEIIDIVLECDAKRRELNSLADGLKAKQNQASKQIPLIKKEGGDIAPILKEMNEIKAKVKELDADISEVEKEQKDLILSIPNIPNESVPVGKSDEDNLGFTYAVLDRYIKTGHCDDEAVQSRIEHLHRCNLHKLRPLPMVER